ncbi:uncharacterized protein LOC144036127 [Vanacampus margaritifer]
MSLSRERVVSALVSEGGRVSKAKLLASFQDALECADRDEKARNRELFKSLVNSVAYVRRGDDGVPYVLLKKVYLTGTQQQEEEQPGTVNYAGREQEEILQTGEQDQGQLETLVNTKRLNGQEQQCEPQHSVSETILEVKSHVGEQEREGEHLDQGQPETVANPTRNAGQEQEGKTNKQDSKSCSEPKEEESLKKAVVGVRSHAELEQEFTLQTGDVEQGPPETAVNSKRCPEQKQKGQQDSRSYAGEGEEASLKAGEQEQGPPEPAGDSQSQAKQEQEHTDHFSPFELALQRSKYSDMRIKQTLDVKPYALPLRMPPTNRTEVPKPKADPYEPPKADPFQSQLKTAKVSNDSRSPSVVPLEPSEHEWLVKCASGHWSQVYGLLLRDHQLADKQDFMSGFTALHWAAKCGNSDMLVKILDTSRWDGAGVDVNVRTHGGYTPLHVAALHRQDYVVAMLVGEYGADVTVRDNGGKRAYHYLHQDTAQSLREMLGEPKSQQSPERSEDAENVPELSKGLHSISRLFQPHLSAQRRKHKQRPAFYSLGEEPQDQRHDSAFRQRLASDAFA